MCSTQRVNRGENAAGNRSYPATITVVMVQILSRLMGRAEKTEMIEKAIEMITIPVCRATERDSLTYKRIPFRYFDERFSESLTPTHEKESFIVSTNLNAFLRAYAEPAQDRGHLCAGSCSVWEQAAAAPRQNLIFHRPAHSLLRIGGNLCRIRKTGKVLDRRRLPSETPEKHDQRCRESVPVGSEPSDTPARIAQDLAALYTPLPDNFSPAIRPSTVQSCCRVIF